jgi:hypothetical protein
MWDDASVSATATTLRFNTILLTNFFSVQATLTACSYTQLTVDQGTLGSIPWQPELGSPFTPGFFTKCDGHFA